MRYKPLSVSQRVRRRKRGSGGVWVGFVSKGGEVWEMDKPAEDTAASEPGPELATQ